MAACIALSPLLAIGVSRTLKTMTSRPRPPLRLVRGSRFDSFPSSHTAGEAALVWATANALPGSSRTRATFIVLALVDIALVGSARVAEGAHWPTDAFAGAAIGIAVSEGIMALLRPRDEESATLN